MSEDGGSVIKSVTRVFQVLELFERRRAPLTAIKVGRQLDYPPSSALALLKSMVVLGYLSFDRIDRSYFPTARLSFLGRWLDSALHHGQSNLIAVVEALNQATGESVALSCQNDLDMQYVHIVQGPQLITLNIQPGALAPLFRSSIGLTALSARPDAEIRQLAQRHDRTAKDAAGRVDLAQVLAAVEGVRRRGWFAGYDMYIDGVGAISWLLPNDDGPRTLVLSISGPSQRIRENQDAITTLAPRILRDHGVLPPARQA